MRNPLRIQWTITIALAVYAPTYCVCGESLRVESAKLREAQSALIGKLIDAVKSPATRFEREIAIEELSAIGDSRAAPVLIEFLTLEAELSGSVSRLQKFPAARALASIGPTVFPAIEARLMSEVSDRELHILAFVVYGFDGQGVGSTRVARSIRQEKRTELQRDDLEKLYTLLEQVDFLDPDQRPK